MFANNAKAAFFVLLCFVYTSAEDYYDDYQDGVPYYGDGPGIQLADGNITVKDFARMVREEVDAVTRQKKEELTTKILEDKRLDTKINYVREKALEEERKCGLKNDSYWEPGIPECRSCFMERCQEHEACRQGCRATLKIKQLEDNMTDVKRKLDDQKEEIASMRDTIQTQHIWLNVFGAISSVTLVGGVGSFIAFFFWVRSLRLSSPTEASNDRNPANRRKKLTGKIMCQKARAYICCKEVSDKQEVISITNRTEDAAPGNGRVFQEGQHLMNDHHV